MALIQATKDERNDIVSMLAKNGASLEYGDEHEKTALMWASMQGSVETAKILLGAKANPDACDSNGRTALSLAIDLNQLGIKNLLKPPPSPQETGGGEKGEEIRKAENSNGSAADTKGVIREKDDSKRKSNSYSNGHEKKEEDQDNDDVDDMVFNLNEELRAGGDEVDAYEEEKKQMRIKRKELQKKKKKQKKAAKKRKEGMAPKDVPALLTKAGLAPGLRDKIMEEGYDEIDWYMTANERDWERMMRDTGITERVKERIMSCTK